jgi:hypothetical protein
MGKKYNKKINSIELMNLIIFETCCTKKKKKQKIWKRDRETKTLTTENEEEDIFEEVNIAFFAKLLLDMNTQFHEIWHIPSRMNTKKARPTH